MKTRKNFRDDDNGSDVSVTSRIWALKMKNFER
jgi:hypothetical protein